MEYIFTACYRICYCKNKKCVWDYNCYYSWIQKNNKINTKKIGRIKKLIINNLGGTYFTGKGKPKKNDLEFLFFNISYEERCLNR